MNIGRLIGGIVCVAVAVLLAVLAAVLPSDEFVFTVGDTNMPFLPSVILGIVGVALVATSKGAAEVGAAGGDDAGEASTGESSTGESSETRLSEKAQLNKQLERMGWGAFLIMLGGFALIPDERVPAGTWSIGLGVIWLGLNAARYSKGIRMSLFTTILGAIAVGSGILELAGLNSIGGAVFLIVLGVYVIFKPALERGKLFGKAEES